MMYTSLGLPQAILDVTNGLPVDILKECLSHILLTGEHIYRFNLMGVWHILDSVLTKFLQLYSGEQQGPFLV
jgi:hypothetical protein